MLKIKIHPTFLIFAIILTIQNRFPYLIATLVVITIHEFAHYKTAYNLGYYIEKLTLMPFGAMLNCDNDYVPYDNAKISFAGPISNLLTCLVLLATWWLSPASYNYTKIFFTASLTIATYNLLPIFPLDGANIIISIVKNKNKTITIIKRVGYLISGILSILFLLSFFDKINLSIGISGATIFIASLNANDEFCYKHITEKYCKKNISKPIEKKTVMVHQDLKLLRLLKHIDAGSETCFEIIDDNHNLITTLNEKEVKQLCSNANLHCSIKELLYL